MTKTPALILCVLLAAPYLWWAIVCVRAGLTEPCPDEPHGDVPRLPRAMKREG